MRQLSISTQGSSIVPARRCHHHARPRYVGDAALRAKVETWRQEGPTAFAKCHREGVVISDNGRVRLGHALAPWGRWRPSGCGTWLKRARGVIRGHRRRRQGLSPRAQGRCALGRSSTIRAIPRFCRWPVAADGTVYAGTGPNGKVVNLSDPKHPASRPGPKVQYIWDLAADAQGNLYAATGPTGQLWKRSADGKWAMSYDSKATHLLCLAIGADGRSTLAVMARA